jgi:membrane-associated phospholipid phosphatase
MSALAQLLQLDTSLFSLINGTWRNDVFDLIMPILREKLTWIPLYVALLVWISWHYRQRAYVLILALVLTAGISDTLSSRVVKPGVQRLRPCNDPQLSSQVVLLVPCGSGYSFTSSHAANHFALAAFLFFALGHLQRRTRWLWWAWAASIAYAQVYVGVHYPLDVLMGAGLGTALGMLVYQLLRKYFAL